MRILFDHSLPIGVRRVLRHHHVVVAKALHWQQLSNGALLKAAEAAAFDVLVTADQKLEYQQNLAHRKIALVVVGSNFWPLVRAHLPEIAAAVDACRPSSYSFVEIPLPPKPKPKPAR